MDRERLIQLREAVKDSPFLSLYKRSYDTLLRLLERTEPPKEGELPDWAKPKETPPPPPPPKKSYGIFSW
jgi:hypothetical protein